MIFVARFPTPSTKTFIPFTDSVAKTYLNDSICGPLQYTIVEGYSFVSLIPSVSGNNIDPWTISVTTTSLADIKTHTVTLKTTLVNYPTVTAVSLTFSLEIMHPCVLTVINAAAISAMTFTIGDVSILTEFL